MAYKSEDSSSPWASALSITFNGPMLFDFVPEDSKDTVDIYVPFCPYHEAGFFFSSGSFSETDLWNCALKQVPGLQMGQRSYTITGVPGNTNMPSDLPAAFPEGPGLAPITPPENLTGSLPPDKVFFLSLSDNLERGKGFPWTKSKAMFKLSVPMPPYVGAMYCDHLEVVADSATTPKQPSSIPHCTALRFFYSWSGASDINLMTPDGLSRVITPPIYNGLPAMVDIEVRYEGLNIMDENDPHSDARSCFASLTALAGTTWWPVYDDGMSSPTNSSRPRGGKPVPRDPCGAGGRRVGPFFHTGADCHAPIIVNGLELS